MPMPEKRWGIAIAGCLLQVCLGSVYAWSYFQMPLMTEYHWNNAQVSCVFSLAICFLGLAAAWGGMNLAKIGPRRLAMCGGVLFGGGSLLAAWALSRHSLPGLYLSYGVMGGVGLGLGYVTPVATAAKWFPDRKGLVTGMVIMGFGLGALLTSKVLAPALMSLAAGNLVSVFAWMGAFFMVAATGCGALLRNPPEPATPAPDVPAHRSGPLATLVCSRQFLLMWGIFFCNIVAGIAIIGFQSPLLQDLMRRGNSTLSPAGLASAGATLIAASSLFNGLGRFLWGGLSDRLGRLRTFRIILASQAVVFLLLAVTANPWLFAVLICYILLCYGGGFGTMPSFVLEVYGSRVMPMVYGCLLTAWSLGGIVGPQMVAWLKDHYAHDAGPISFLVGAAFMGVGLVLSMRLPARTSVATALIPNPVAGR